MHIQTTRTDRARPGRGLYFLNDFPRLRAGPGGDLYRVESLPARLRERRSPRPPQVRVATRARGFGYRNVTGFGASSGWGFTIQPANVFSPNDQPKSMYFVTSFCCAADNHLRITAFHDPFGTPTFTGITIVAANTYSTPPDATQQGTATKIATGDQRISGSPYYAAGSIYAALATSGGAGEPAIIMYQIQPFVVTDGTANDGEIASARILNEIPHGLGSASAWYFPAQQPDGEGKMSPRCSASRMRRTSRRSPIASRRAAQAVGTWPDGGVFARSGTGPYTGGRWGDYFATAPAGLVSGGGAPAASRKCGSPERGPITSTIGIR